MRQLMFTMVCVVAGALPLAGCGEQSTTFAFERLTVTQIQQVNPPMGINMVGLVPEPVIITGGDFTNIVGTTVEVRWATKDAVDITLPGPKILHDGERDWTSTSGYVTSPTTIEAVSPALDIPCDLMLMGNVNGCIQVFLGSNAYSEPFTVPGLFQIPNPANFAFNIASAPACDPVPFTLTGAALAPVGGSVVLHWLDPTASGAFEGLDETTTLATITSDTTIEGLTPTVVLCGPNGASDLTIQLVRIEWVSEPICITLAPPVNLLIEAPDLTTIEYRAINLPQATYAGGYLPGELPSTWLEDPASLEKFDHMEGFTITGTGFGPTGTSALITFTDPTGGAVFDASGGPVVTVPGVVINDTTIEGTVPGINAIANRLAANLPTDVLVELQGGCCVSQTAFATFRAPPTVTGAVNTEAGQAGGLGDGFYTLATPTELFACHSFFMQLQGTNFYDVFPNSVLRIALYVTEEGISRRIGTGVPPTVFPGYDIGFNIFAWTSTVLQGQSRIDGALGAFDEDADGLVGTTARVTNPDGQCGELAFDYDLIGRQINRSNDGATINSNVDVAIDPTSTTNGMNAPPVAHDFGLSTNDVTPGANLAAAFENDASDQSVGNSFSGTSLFVDWSRDGGVTWARTTIDGTVDGLPAGAVRSFPQVEYDAFGNLWMSYLVDDFTGGAGTETSHVMLLVSFDQGATFGGGPISSTAAGDGGLYFEPSLATGPDALGTGEVAYVAWVDATTGLPDRIALNGRPSAGFGAAGAPFGTVTADTVAPGPGVFFRSHATPAVGPSGEVYVSWVEPDFTNFPPVSDIRINVDLDGALAGSTFGTDTIVANDVELPLGPPASQPDIGRLIPLQDMAVVQTGTHAGRVIVTYEGTSISSGLINPTVLHVIAARSDTFGLSWSDGVVHQVDTADQFLPEVATDPMTGKVYISYYDTRASAPVNNLTQRFVASSPDGASWGTPLLLSDGQSAQTAGDEEAVEYGLWCGLSAWGGCILSGWADTADNGGESDAVLKLFQMYTSGD